MSVTMLNPILLRKQELGVPLTHSEARTAVEELNVYIRENTGDNTYGVLLLATVGSLYFEDVWDLLILESEL